MKRSYWGEFEDATVKKKELRENEIILPISKIDQFRALKVVYPNTEDEKKILIKNALVTQTVETINQSESIKCIMDTYLDASQLMPNIDFPASNSAKMKEESVFSKPVWFCQPKMSATLSPKNYTELTKPTVLEALKKSLCGLLKMTGFTEIDESALKCLCDGIDEFYKSFMENVRDVMIAEDRERENVLDILTLEKAYTNLSNKSLTTLHNYFKDEIIKSNRDEINEFKDIFQDYDKMLHENNLAQNLTNLTNDPKENGEFMSFLDASSIVSGNGGSNINVMNFLDGDNFRGIMDGGREADNITTDSMLNE